MSDECVRLHGLTIRSEFALDGPSADRCAPPDLVVVRGEVRPIADEVPGGEEWALLHDGRDLRQVVVATPDGWLLRYPRTVDVRISRELDRVVVDVDPLLPDGLVSILVSGAVVSTLLQLRGDLVLHASALDLGEDGEEAVALVGPSGAGKSTSATLLCSAGARLVTDDVLRVDVGRDGVTAWRGPATSRLRPAASVLAEGRSSTTSADGRTVLRHAHTTHDRVDLRAVLLPRPNRADDEVRVVRLTGAQALVPLLAAPRVLGWSHPPSLALQLQQLGRLAAAVPVAELHLPWGPPFRRGLGEEAAAALRRAQLVGEGAGGSSTA